LDLKKLKIERRRKDQTKKKGMKKEQPLCLSEKKEQK
jgi:hypothetical protein